MYNILQYFNSLLSYIFGNANSSFMRLNTPGEVITFLRGLSLSSGLDGFFDIINALVTEPPILFSLIVWCLFGWFVLHLLLIYPFKWFRSVIRRCSGR